MKPLCIFKWTDTEGIAHEIEVFKKGDYHRIHQDGSFMLDMYLDEELVWCEIEFGPTKETREIGKLIEKEMM